MTNDIKAPETKGIAGGSFYGDNSTAYVGYGNFPPPFCQGQIPSPGGISTNSSSAGAYPICGGHRQDKFSAHYLLKHPDLQWVVTDLNNTLKIPGLIRINSGSFLIARMWFNGIYNLGKVFASLGSIWIGIEGGETKIDSGGFEVLACSNATLQSPCGKFIYLNILVVIFLLRNFCVL